jgi:hypothetical protein
VSAGRKRPFVLYVPEDEAQPLKQSNLYEDEYDRAMDELTRQAREAMVNGLVKLALAAGKRTPVPVPIDNLVHPMPKTMQ